MARLSVASAALVIGLAGIASAQTTARYLGDDNGDFDYQHGFEFPFFHPSSCRVDPGNSCPLFPSSPGNVVASQQGIGCLQALLQDNTAPGAAGEFSLGNSCPFPNAPFPYQSMEQLINNDCGGLHGLNGPVVYHQRVVMLVDRSGSINNDDLREIGSQTRELAAEILSSARYIDERTVCPEDEAMYNRALAEEQDPIPDPDVQTWIQNRIRVEVEHTMHSFDDGSGDAGRTDGTYQEYPDLGQRYVTSSDDLDSSSWMARHQDDIACNDDPDRNGDNGQDAHGCQTAFNRGVASAASPNHPATMRGTATAAAISTLYDKLDIDSDDPTWEGQRRAAGEVPVPGVNRQSKVLIIFTDGMTQEEGAFIHPNNDAVDPTADFIQRRSPECTERYIAQNSGCRTDASIYARTQCRACDWVPTPHAERAFENDAVAIAAQRWKAQGYTVIVVGLFTGNIYGNALYEIGHLWHLRSLSSFSLDGGQIVPVDQDAAPGSVPPFHARINTPYGDGSFPVGARGNVAYGSSIQRTFLLIDDPNQYARHLGLALKSLRISHIKEQAQCPCMTATPTTVPTTSEPTPGPSPSPTPSPTPTPTTSPTRSPASTSPTNPPSTSPTRNPTTTAPTTSEPTPSPTPNPTQTPYNYPEHTFWPTPAPSHHACFHDCPLVCGRPVNKSLATCDPPSSTPVTAGIQILIDQSASIPVADYNTAMANTLNTARALLAAGSGATVGIRTFDGSSQEWIAPTSDVSALEQPYPTRGARTNTGLALQQTWDSIQSQNHYQDDDLKILVIITDGLSNHDDDDPSLVGDANRVERHAQRFKDAGWNIYIIWVDGASTEDQTTFEHLRRVTYPQDSGVWSNGGWNASPQPYDESVQTLYVETGQYRGLELSIARSIVAGSRQTAAGPDCAQSGGPNAGPLQPLPGSMYGTANTYIVDLHGDPAFRLWSTTISTCESQFDTAISVRDEAGNRVGFNNDGDFGASDDCSSGASFLALHHLAPGRYTIYVEAEGGTLDSFAADEYTISVECEHILCRHPHQCYLDSNAPGVQGPKGDQGATGESGDAALPAEPGLNGTKGDPGDPAVRGLPGSKGDKGTDGRNGLKGDPGTDGTNGNRGPQGPRGDADPCESYSPGHLAVQVLIDQSSSIDSVMLGGALNTTQYAMVRVLHPEFRAEVLRTTGVAIDQPWVGANTFDQDAYLWIPQTQSITDAVNLTYRPFRADNAGTGTGRAMMQTLDGQERTGALSLPGLSTHPEINNARTRVLVLVTDGVSIEECDDNDSECHACATAKEARATEHRTGADRSDWYGQYEAFCVVEAAAARWHAAGWSISVVWFQGNTPLHREVLEHLQAVTYPLDSGHWDTASEQWVESTPDDANSELTFFMFEGQYTGVLQQTMETIVYRSVSRVSDDDCDPGLDGIKGSKGMKAQNGNQGDPGSPGAPGDKGPAGTAGEDGLDGGRGDKGYQGEPGQKGPKGPVPSSGANGDKGQKGRQNMRNGENGLQGIPGVPGTPAGKGEKGEIGEKGPRGPNGLPGLPGPTGLAGFNGPAGMPGDNGRKGRNGENGVPGPSGGVGDKGMTHKGSVGDEGLKGFKAPQAPTGPRGHKGPRGPAASDCSDVYNVDRWQRKITDWRASEIEYRAWNTDQCMAAAWFVQGAEAQIASINSCSATDFDATVLTVLRSDIERMRTEYTARALAVEAEVQEYATELNEAADACANEGRKGHVGLVGAKGDPGPKGIKGQRRDSAGPGDKGEKGIKGDAGEIQNDGTKGVDGVDGLNGNKGGPGARGRDGEQGLPGDKGDPALAGPKGSDGDKGNVGPMANKGRKGLKGESPENGLPGSPGDPGSNGGPGSYGSRGALGDEGSVGRPGQSGEDGLPASNGEPGAPGSDGVNGRVGVPGRAGLDGHAYRGQPGHVGHTGLHGRAGLPGTAGTRGRNGQPGSKGAAGDDGTDGLDGEAGRPGPLGTKGAKGLKGREGEDGLQGPSGDEGAVGEDGAAGEQGFPGHCILTPEYRQWVNDMSRWMQVDHIGQGELQQFTDSIMLYLISAQTSCWAHYGAIQAAVEVDVSYMRRIVTLTSQTRLTELETARTESMSRLHALAHRICFNCRTNDDVNRLMHCNMLDGPNIGDGRITGPGNSSGLDGTTCRLEEDDCNLAGGLRCCHPDDWTAHLVAAGHGNSYGICSSRC